MKVIRCRLKAAGGAMQGADVVYAKVVDAGRIDAGTLVDMMVDNCSVSRCQVLAVLYALAEVVSRMLVLGHSVEVPGLGFMTPKVRGRVSVSKAGNLMVEKAKSSVVFKPKRELAGKFDDVVYKVVSENVRANVSLSQEAAAEVAEALMVRKGIFSVSDFAGEASCSESYAAGVLKRLVACGRLGRVRMGRMSVFRPPRD